MYLIKNLTLENWFTIISLIFVAIGGVFVFFQWSRSNKTRRAEFINQIIEKIRFDDNLSKSMYIIEYDKKWYNQSFHNSDSEISIDKLFTYVDYICYLKANKNISSTEFKIFQYELNRIYISNSTKQYLWNLYHFSLKNETSCTFQFLINYGIDFKLFPNDFKKNKSLYSKTLEW